MLVCLDSPKKNHKWIHIVNLSPPKKKTQKKGVVYIDSSNPTGHTSQSSQCHTKPRIAVMVWQVHLLRHCRSFWALWDVRWKEPGVRFWLSAWNSHETGINTQPHGLTLEAARGSDDSWNQSVTTLSYTYRNYIIMIITNVFNIVWLFRQIRSSCCPIFGFPSYWHNTFVSKTDDTYLLESSWCRCHRWHSSPKTFPRLFPPGFQQQGGGMVRNGLIQTNAQGQLVFAAVGRLHKTGMTSLSTPQ